MILNIINNERILRQASNIHLTDFTVLTGENGSGKTQLLEYLRDSTQGIYRETEIGELNSDDGGQPKKLINPLLNNEGIPLKEIVYSYPGLRNALYEDPPTGEGLLNNIKSEWMQLRIAVFAYHTLRGKLFDNENEETQEINNVVSSTVIQY